MSNSDSAARQAASQPQGHLVRTPSRFAGLGGVALLLGMAIIVAVALLYFLQVKQGAPNQQLAAAQQDAAAALRARIAADEARLAILEKAAQRDVAVLAARIGKLETAPDTQSSARLDDLDRRLAAIRADLDFRLSALERNALNSNLPQRVAALSLAQAALDARTAKLERVNPSQTMRSATAELALANLVRASGTSGAFAVELQAFAAVMPDATEIAELAPISRKGAPARTELAARYSDMASVALAAENSTHAKTWLGALWSNVGNIIVVRRIGYTKGGDSESILARGGAKLNRGDLGGAIAELKSLNGAARIAAQPWLVDAQARYAVERDLAALATRMAKLLATP